MKEDEAVALKPWEWKGDELWGAHKASGLTMGRLILFANFVAVPDVAEGWKRHIADALNAYDPQAAASNTTSETAMKAAQKIDRYLDYDAVAMATSADGKTPSEFITAIIEAEFTTGASADGQDFCYAEGDEGAEFCGEPRSLHCKVLGDSAFWKSYGGQNHLVKCIRDDHLIHHHFIATDKPAGQPYATFEAGWNAGFQEAQRPDRFPSQNRCEALFRELFPTANKEPTND